MDILFILSFIFQKCIWGGLICNIIVIIQQGHAESHMQLFWKLLYLNIYPLD